MTHLGRKFGRYCPDSSVEIVNMLMTVVLILIHNKTERFQDCAKLSDKVLMELQYFLSIPSQGLNLAISEQVS
jgi:hypothetical protein